MKCPYCGCENEVAQIPEGIRVEFPCRNCGKFIKAEVEVETAAD